MENSVIVANAAENATNDGFLNKLNLPQLVVGPAGAAISKLVAGVVDIPAAWLEGKSRAIRDNTEAKSRVRSAVVDKAAEEAGKNTDVVDRATERFLGDLGRKQQNREAVAQVALEQLSSEPETSFSESVSDDWLDYFSAYAEKANSDKMRDLWGRVLAGEIRRSGSFSLLSMRFMSELDLKTAKIVEKYFSRVLFEGFIPQRPSYSLGQELEEVTLLENLGLLNGCDGTRTTAPAISESGLFVVAMKKNSMFIYGNPGTRISFTCLILTPLGKEILSVLTVEDDVEVLKEFGSTISKQGLSKIISGPSKYVESKLVISPVETLWSE